jgi:hypothetical protein
MNNNECNRRLMAALCDDTTNWEKYTIDKDEILYEGRAVARYKQEGTDLNIQMYTPIQYINLEVTI